MSRKGVSMDWLGKFQNARAVIALVMVGGTIAFVLLHIPVPDAWWASFGGAITFYFLGKGNSYA